MSNVDWNHWLNMPTVTIGQAVALSLGRDPDKMSQTRTCDGWVYLKSSFKTKEEMDEFYKRCRLLINNAFSDKNICSPECLLVGISQSQNHTAKIHLEFFPEWALSVNWDIPKELKSLEPTKKEVGVEPNENPWDIHQEGDPQPIVLWYTHARYFARKLIKENPRLLKRRGSLCFESSKELDAHRIYKRGGKEAPDTETIKKAHSNIKLD